jgi:hypothetical protein
MVPSPPCILMRAGKPVGSTFSLTPLWPMTSLTAVQHHTRFSGNSRHATGRHQLRAGPTLYSAVLDEAVRPIHRENRPAQALMPPLGLTNRSSGSESGLYAAAYRKSRDHLLRVRLSALAGSAVHRMIAAKGPLQAEPSVRCKRIARPVRSIFPQSVSFWPGPEGILAGRRGWSSPSSSRGHGAPKMAGSTETDANQAHPHFQKSGLTAVGNTSSRGA